MLFMSDGTNTQSVVGIQLADDLLADLHLERLVGEDRIQFLESFLYVVYMRVLQRVIDSISTKDQEELDGLMKKNPDDLSPVREYLLSRIPEFPRIEKEVVGQYIKELVDDMNLKMQEAK